jgi:hypothetical protein
MSVALLAGIFWLPGIIVPGFTSTRVLNALVSAMLTWNGEGIECQATTKASNHN